MDLNEYCRIAHLNAREKGFYDDHINIVGVLSRLGAPGYAEAADHAFELAAIARMHSELSEAVEALRAGNPASEKIPGFSHVEEELADLAIRLFDWCGFKGYDIQAAVNAKMEYNAGRVYKHGKVS